MSNVEQLYTSRCRHRKWPGSQLCGHYLQWILLPWVHTHNSHFLCPERHAFWSSKIITFLALADFVSAAGYIIGSVNFLTHYNKIEGKECQVFEDICVAQATFTSWSLLTSFLWTAILAFYLYLIIVYEHVAVAARFMSLYHIIAWGFPLIIVIPPVATGHLGYAPYAASNWCFVKTTDFTHGLTTNPTEIIIILFNGKLWEMLTYAIISVLFILVASHIAKVCIQ